MRTSVLKTVQAKEARANFSRLLDEVENGNRRLIIRNARPVAALVPPDQARLLAYLRHVLAELGESLELSGDADVIAQVAKADAEVAQGKIVWYEG